MAIVRVTSNVATTTATGQNGIQLVPNASSVACFRVNTNQATFASGAFGIALLAPVSGATVQLEKMMGVTASDAPTVLAQNNPSAVPVSATGSIAVVNPNTCNVSTT